MWWSIGGGIIIFALGMFYLLKAGLNMEINRRMEILSCR